MFVCIQSRNLTFYSYHSDNQNCHSRDKYFRSSPTRGGEITGGFCYSHLNMGVKISTFSSLPRSVTTSLLFALLLYRHKVSYILNNHEAIKVSSLNLISPYPTICAYLVSEDSQYVNSLLKSTKQNKKKKKKEEERKSLGREDVLLYERFNFFKNLSRCPTFSSNSIWT